MSTLKSKSILAGMLLSGSCLVSAHTGGHGLSSWHHYLASADHVAVFLLLALSGLGVISYLARKLIGNCHRA